VQEKPFIVTKKFGKQEAPTKGMRLAD